MSIKPKADQTRWTLVLTARRSRTEPLVATKMIRFATKALAEAELAGQGPRRAGLPAATDRGLGREGPTWRRIGLNPFRLAGPW
jgi:hypothetical protein